MSEADRRRFAEIGGWRQFERAADQDVCRHCGKRITWNAKPACWYDRDGNDVCSGAVYHEPAGARP